MGRLSWPPRGQGLFKQHTHPTTIHTCRVGCPGAVVVSNSTYIHTSLDEGNSNASLAG